MTQLFILLKRDMSHHHYQLTLSYHTSRGVSANFSLWQCSQRNGVISLAFWKHWTARVLLSVFFTFSPCFSLSLPLSPLHAWVRGHTLGYYHSFMQFTESDETYFFFVICAFLWLFLICAYYATFHHELGGEEETGWFQLRCRALLHGVHKVPY